MRRLLIALAVAAVAAGCGASRGQGVPRGFRPETAAAQGTSNYWVLGDYGCGRSRCLALLQSRDAGRRFRRLATPPLPTQGTVPTLVFANPYDGFAYVRGAGRLYVTRDGGRTWRPTGSGAVTDVAVGAGDVYAIFGRNRLERSPLSRGRWRVLTPPGSPQWLLSLAVHGSNVRLLATPRGALAGGSDEILRSEDRGSTFTTRPAPCVPGLAGTLVPAGNGVLWAVCPTGMMAGLWLSSNGGRSFSSRSFGDPGAAHSPALTNGAAVFAASSRDALLYGGAEGPLFRTSDAGVHWALLPQTSRFRQVFWLGFTTSQVGAAVVDARGVGPSLWRTTDGGTSWSRIRLSP
jgi:photosystem II stability/assembly factor-like uncharacterized protein